LELGDKLIALAHEILVLLVLVVGAVGFDNAALARYTVNSARNTARGDKPGKVPRKTDSVSKRTANVSWDGIGAGGI